MQTKDASALPRLSLNPPNASPCSRTIHEVNNKFAFFLTSCDIKLSQKYICQIGILYFMLSEIKSKTWLSASVMPFLMFFFFWKQRADKDGSPHCLQCHLCMTSGKDSIKKTNLNCRFQKVLSHKQTNDYKGLSIYNVP